MKHTESTSKYRRLARNMVLVTVLAALVPLFVVQIITLRGFSDAYSTKVREHMGELVQKHSQNIDRFLTERLAYIRMLARANSFDQLSDQQFLNQKLAMLKEEYAGVFVDLGLVDADGVQVAYAGPYNLLGADYSETYWFKQAMSSDQYISDVFTGLRGTPHFIVAVRQSRHGRDWILRSTIDFEAFNSLVENIRLGRTGFAFILNRTGLFQTRPRTEVSMNDEPLQEFLYSNLEVQPGTVYESKDRNGVEWIMVMAPLKHGEWILCCRQESADALKVLGRGENAAYLALLLAGIIVGVAAYIMARRMVDRLQEADKEREVMSEKVIEAGRLASIGELAAGIAHEINNPVAIMVEEAGWIQDLMTDGDMNTPDNMGELERAMAQIRTQGSRCKEITHKLLSFARKTDSRTCDIDLNQMALDAVSLLKQKTRYANVHIHTELEDDIPAISASPTEIQQVLVNLINNSVDAIGSNGGDVVLSTRKNGGSVELVISDNGPGIPEPDIDRIFDPFFTTKPVGQGTGLGLSICFGIIDKLGGVIRVKSRVGEGTSFIIKLPAVEEQPGDSGSHCEDIHKSEQQPGGGK